MKNGKESQQSQRANDLQQKTVNVNSQRRDSEQKSTAAGNIPNEKYESLLQEPKKQLLVLTTQPTVKDHTEVQAARANQIITLSNSKETLEKAERKEDITKLCDHMKNLANVTESLAKQVAEIQSRVTNFWKDVEIHLTYEQLVEYAGNIIINNECLNDIAEEINVKEHNNDEAIDMHAKGNKPVRRLTTSPSVTQSTSATCKQLNKSMTQNIKHIAKERSQDMEKRYIDKHGDLAKQAQTTMLAPRIANAALTKNNATNIIKESKDSNKITKLAKLDKFQYSNKFKQIQIINPTDVLENSIQKDEKLEKPPIRIQKLGKGFRRHVQL